MYKNLLNFLKLSSNKSKTTRKPKKRNDQSFLGEKTFGSSN